MFLAAVLQASPAEHTEEGHNPAQDKVEHEKVLEVAQKASKATHEAVSKGRELPYLTAEQLGAASKILRTAIRRHLQPC